MFVLPQLPFAPDALAPHMSRDTVVTHYEKHHAGYVKKTNTLVAEEGLEGEALEAVILRARGRHQKLFNNAAQAWNHAFFWQSLTPKGANAPDAPLGKALAQAFGSMQGLRERWMADGQGHFGSGYLWLVAQRDGAVALETKHDADSPLGYARPLLCCDLWEHAYYLDRKNDRGAYLEAVFDTLLNWSFAAAQYEAGEGDVWRYPAPMDKAA